MAKNRKVIVAWVSSQVLPHEADVRAWLRNRGVATERIDDVVQEAYCRLAALEDVTHIECGRAYFYKTALNILLEEVRRARIVRIDTASDIELLRVMDDEPTPERIAAGCLELRLVQSVIEGLPAKCRRIFELRRVQGVSQREIANMLGISENVVEAQSVRALKLILKALAQPSGESPTVQPKSYEPARNSRRN